MTDVRVAAERRNGRCPRSVSTVKGPVLNAGAHRLTDGYSGGGVESGKGCRFVVRREGGERKDNSTCPVNRGLMQTPVRQEQIR